MLLFCTWCPAYLSTCRWHHNFGWACGKPCITALPYCNFLPEQEVWYGKGEAKDYEMANYWDTNFKMNTFGMDIDEVGHFWLGLLVSHGPSGSATAFQVA